MAGTLANPVILDPFQVITGVAWGGFTHIAFQLPVAREYEFDQEFCETSIGPPPDGHRGVYVTTTHFEFTDPTQPVLLPVMMGYRSGSWHALSEDDDVSAVGLPGDGPVGGQSYDPWEYFAQGYSGVTPMTNPYALWQEAAGAASDVPLPSGGDFFNIGASATIDMWGQPYTGPDDGCYFPGGSSAIQRYAPRSSSFERFSPFVVSVSGVVVTVNGKQYQGVARKVIGMEEPGDPLDAPLTGVLWVLCERI